jgi:hypothetical protein
VSPQEKAELERIAATEKLTVSKTGRALLAEMLRQKLQTQQAALLEPIIDRIFSKNMKHLAFLVIRDAFTNEYTKAITINILNNLPGMTQSIVEEIVTRSADTAKRNMLRRTPQLETVLQEVERWFQEENRAAV